MTVRVCPICDIADCATHRPTTTLDLAERIEKLERERDKAMMTSHDLAKIEYRDLVSDLEDKLAKAVEALQKISRHANRSCSAIAARALAELEKSE